MAKRARSFDAQAFLESAGFGKQVVTYARGAVIFSQGDPYNGGLKINPSLVTVVVHQ